MANKKAFFILPFLVLFFFAFRTNAAIVSLSSQTRAFGVGQAFSVDIKIDTEETFINAAQAIVRFPTDILELTGVDKTGSVFGFWPDEPKISNGDGTLIFTGGTSKGVAGATLQVLKMKFKAKSAGLAELTLRDAAVTASDGKGTNVLSALKGTSVTVGAVAVAPAPLSPAEEPQKVVRKPVVSAKLPLKPQLRAPLYPDETRWYDRSGETVIFWNVPNDITAVATALDKSPFSQPEKPEPELFAGKNFGVLKEGVWYVHVQFKNNIGWGETSHYKISLDLTPPLPFEIQIENKASDNPSPEIRYEANDTFSGLAGYSISLDGKDPVRTTSTVFKFSPQPPGKHLVVIRASDLAGNSVEDGQDFEVLALPTPTVDFFTSSVRQGEFVFASGRAISGGLVDVRVTNDKDQEFFKGVADADATGRWDITIKEPLATGRYLLTVGIRDSRGAMSLAVPGLAFNVSTKKIFSFGIIELGWAEILLLSILLGLFLVSIAGWYYTKRKQTRGAYQVIVGRDLEKLTTLILGDVKELEGLPFIKDEKSSLKASFLLEKIKETAGKMAKYLGEEIEKLK